jgi:hypothetical protein
LLAQLGDLAELESVPGTDCFPRAQKMIYDDAKAGSITAPSASGALL